MKDKSMKKTIVIINEDKHLLHEQERILKDTFGEYEFFRVSRSGMSVEEMDDAILTWNMEHDYVFITPIGYLLMFMPVYGFKANLFINPNRTEKQFDDGKRVYIPAREGWILISSDKEISTK